MSLEPGGVNAHPANSSFRFNLHAHKYNHHRRHQQETAADEDACGTVEIKHRPATGSASAYRQLD